MSLKVSIITVCFNSEETIRDTIESVRIQDYGDIEYIIIDGGSDDSTMEIVRKYEEDIDVIVSESDKGIYDAMNKGIDLASGDVVGILNSDDYLNYSGVITDVVNRFILEPGVDLVFGDLVIVDPKNTREIIRFYNSEKFRSWKLRFGWMPPHPATFIKKSTYEKVGRYSLDYNISGDFEFFVRALLVCKLKYSRIDKVLVRMRAGGISSFGIKSSFLLNSEIVSACKKNGVYTNLLFVFLKIPFKVIEFFKRPKAIT